MSKAFEAWLSVNFPDLARKYVGPGEYRERERMLAAWQAATERAAMVVGKLGDVWTDDPIAMPCWDWLDEIAYAIRSDE